MRVKSARRSSRMTTSSPIQLKRHSDDRHRRTVIPLQRILQLAQYHLAHLPVARTLLDGDSCRHRLLDQRFEVLVACGPALGVTRLAWFELRRDRRFAIANDIGVLVTFEIFVCSSVGVPLGVGVIEWPLIAAMKGRFTRQLLPAANNLVAVNWIEFDKPPLTMCSLASDKGCPAATKAIEDNVAAA